MVTQLQILTLTAELLALDLRDGERTLAQVQERSSALMRAMANVTTEARRIPAIHVELDAEDDRSLAESEPLKSIRAFVGFITHHAERPDVERDVLAEYVDGLHSQAATLIASFDERVAS